jgi:hypothetical protein
VVESSSKTLTSPRVERWRMLLQPYIGQMSFVHKAGKLHGNVDALSRLPRKADAGGEEPPGWGEEGAGRKEEKVFFIKDGLARRKGFRWEQEGSEGTRR